MPDGEIDVKDDAHPVDPERVDQARAALLPVGEAEELSRLLAAVGDPVRARILSALLAAGELCVGDLALALGVNEDAVTYGLRVLRGGGLVVRRAEGRMGYYRLADDHTRHALVAALGHLSDLARLRPTPPATDASARPPLPGPG